MNIRNDIVFYGSGVSSLPDYNITAADSYLSKRIPGRADPINTCPQPGISPLFSIFQESACVRRQRHSGQVRIVCQHESPAVPRSITKTSTGLCSEGEICIDAPFNGRNTAWCATASAFQVRLTRNPTGTNLVQHFAIGRRTPRLDRRHETVQIVLTSLFSSSLLVDAWSILITPLDNGGRVVAPPSMCTRCSSLKYEVPLPWIERLAFRITFPKGQYAANAIGFNWLE